MGQYCIHIKELAWSDPRTTGLMMLLGIHEDAALSEHHRLWVGEELEKDARQRESRWTENIAVGSKAFIEQTKTELGIRAKGRESKGHGDTYGLRETEAPYVFVKGLARSDPGTHFSKL